MSIDGIPGARSAGRTPTLEGRAGPSASCGAASAAGAGALKFDRRDQFMHRLYEAARGEVEGDRQERVAELRARVQRDAFHPDLRGLAERLVGELVGRAR